MSNQEKYITCQTPGTFQTISEVPGNPVSPGKSPGENNKEDTNPDDIDISSDNCDSDNDSIPSLESESDLPGVQPAEEAEARFARLVCPYHPDKAKYPEFEDCPCWVPHPTLPGRKAYQSPGEKVTFGLVEGANQEPTTTTAQPGAEKKGFASCMEHINSVKYGNFRSCPCWTFHPTEPEKKIYRGRGFSSTESEGSSSSDDSENCSSGVSEITTHPLAEKPTREPQKNKQQRDPNLPRPCFGPKPYCNDNCKCISCEKSNTNSQQKQQEEITSTEVEKEKSKNPTKTAIPEENQPRKSDNSQSEDWRCQALQQQPFCRPSPSQDQHQLESYQGIQERKRFANTLHSISELIENWKRQADLNLLSWSTSTRDRYQAQGFNPGQKLTRESNDLPKLNQGPPLRSQNNYPTTLRNSFPARFWSKPRQNHLQPVPELPRQQSTTWDQSQTPSIPAFLAQRQAAAEQAQIQRQGGGDKEHKISPPISLYGDPASTTFVTCTLCKTTHEGPHCYEGTCDHVKTICASPEKPSRRISFFSSLATYQICNICGGRHIPSFASHYPWSYQDSVVFCTYCQTTHPAPRCTEGYCVHIQAPEGFICNLHHRSQTCFNNSCRLSNSEARIQYLATHLTKHKCSNCYGRHLNSKDPAEEPDKSTLQPRRLETPSLIVCDYCRTTHNKPACLEGEFCLKLRSICSPILDSRGQPIRPPAGKTICNKCGRRHKSQQNYPYRNRGEDEEEATSQLVHCRQCYQTHRKPFCSKGSCLTAESSLKFIGQRGLTKPHFICPVCGKRHLEHQIICTASTEDKDFFCNTCMKKHFPPECKIASTCLEAERRSLSRPVGGFYETQLICPDCAKRHLNPGCLARSSQGTNATGNHAAIARYSFRTSFNEGIRRFANRPNTAPHPRNQAVTSGQSVLYESGLYRSSPEQSQEQPSQGTDIASKIDNLQLCSQCWYAHELPTCHGTRNKLCFQCGHTHSPPFCDNGTCARKRSRFYREPQENRLICANCQGRHIRPGGGEKIITFREYLRIKHSPEAQEATAASKQTPPGEATAAYSVTRFLSNLANQTTQINTALIEETTDQDTSIQAAPGKRSEQKDKFKTAEFIYKTILLVILIVNIYISLVRV